MSHFIIPSGSHSMMRDGNTFIWNTTDGPGTTTKYKFQVGTQSGYYDIFNGSWKTGGVAGLWTDNVTGLPGSGGTLYVRAEYKKYIGGVLKTFYTNPVSFACNP